LTIICQTNRLRAVPSRTKLSQGVRSEIVSRIASGAIPAGSQLPAEPTLAQQLGVSRATLREALRSLEEEGTLTRHRGAGTFVTEGPRLVNNLDVNFGVTEAIRAAGMQPGTLEAAAVEGPASHDEARQLHLEPGSGVVTVERVRTADGRRVVFSRDVLPARLLGRRSALLRRLEEGSVYEVLESQLGRIVHHGIASFRPVLAIAEVSDRLRVPRGAPLLYLRQVDYEAEGQPLLYSHEYHLADAFEFTMVRRGLGRRRKP
jgi:GntR family transcriptional regulator